jgi:hypothetical protein
MATNASPFIVNIVPLQGVVTELGGSGSDTTVLQAQITSLQSMVDTTTKTIYADKIQSFTPSQTIDIFANLNLSNASLLVNSNTVSLPTSASASASASGSTVQAGSNTIGVTGSQAVTFATAFISTPSVTATYRGANPIFITVNSVSASGFTAYAWSNNSAYTVGSTGFSWLAST